MKKTKTGIIVTLILATLLLCNSLSASASLNITINGNIIGTTGSDVNTTITINSNQTAGNDFHSSDIEDLGENIKDWFNINDSEYITFEIPFVEAHADQIIMNIVFNSNTAIYKDLTFTIPSGYIDNYSQDYVVTGAILDIKDKTKNPATNQSTPTTTEYETPYTGD